jgi:hypothetical protein
MQSFDQDRLGTNIEKTQKQTVFSQADALYRAVPGEKDALFSHLPLLT